MIHCVIDGCRFAWNNDCMRWIPWLFAIPTWYVWNLRWCNCSSSINMSMYLCIYASICCSVLYAYVSICLFQYLCYYKVCIIYSYLRCSKVSIEFSQSHMICRDSCWRQTGWVICLETRRSWDTNGWETTTPTGIYPFISDDAMIWLNFVQLDSSCIL